VPTQIQDQTQITVQATFQTDVPAPVIVPTPASLDLSPLTQPGQFMDVPLTLANEGLIGVENVGISVSSSDLYEFDLVTTNIGSLPAHGTVTVPMRITFMPSGVGSSAAEAKTAAKQARSTAGLAVPQDSANQPCTPSLGVAYSYLCGPYGVNSGIQYTILNAQTDCGTAPAPTGGTSVAVTGGGGNAGGAMEE